jgi:hypothetical protein
MGDSGAVEKVWHRRPPRRASLACENHSRGPFGSQDKRLCHMSSAVLRTVEKASGGLFQQPYTHLLYSSLFIRKAAIPSCAWLCRETGRRNLRPFKPAASLALPHCRNCRTDVSISVDTDAASRWAVEITGTPAHRVSCRVSLVASKTYPAGGEGWGVCRAISTAA